MEANKKFLTQNKLFWANVRFISEAIGYTERATGLIKIPEPDDIIGFYKKNNLDYLQLFPSATMVSELGNLLMEYFVYRANILNTFVEKNLMNAEEATKEFTSIKKRVKPPDRLLPMNKQTGDKKKAAFLTGIVNMLIYEQLGDDFEHDPRNLTMVTKKAFPTRTLSRRFDGAYPISINPKVLWEIKEYYHTTTFGSRVADGVYESLLDGMELEELETQEERKILHYLIIDAKYTWWDCGKSYLCRLIDMLNMGYVDVILFGREVIKMLPLYAKNWKELPSYEL